MRNTLRCSSSVLLSAMALLAQAPSKVIGVTDTTPLLAQFDPLCNPTACVPGLPSTTIPWAGGTAHDPRDRATWISNGPLLMKVDPRAGCAVRCAPFTPPLLPAGQVVTGLAYNEFTGRLFMSYSDNRILTFAASGCTLSFLSQCSPVLPNNHVISGLATDDSTGRIFYGTGPWLGASTQPFGLVFVAPQSSPCAPTCQFPVIECTGAPMRAVTGMGYDACAGELYATDGMLIQTVTNTTACPPLSTGCCPAIASLGERLIGLCVLPATETSSGPTCFGGTSPSCVGMRHVLGGDPTIGNLAFALNLVNAPASSFAHVFIDVGPCISPGNTFSGLLCSGMMPTLYFNTAPTGGTGCGGFASIPLPIPNVVALCGIMLSSQYAGNVPPGWSGNFVSNCLTWVISAS